MATKKNMSVIKYPITIPINNLQIWHAQNWVRYDNVTSPTFLKIHFDQILIVSDNKILESINCNGKLKGFYKDDNLILLLGTMTNKIRKIKFQIKDMVAQCLQELTLRFPLVNYANPTSNVNTERYSNIEDVLKKALEKNDRLYTLPLPNTYGNFVKMCLLDPLFPQLVLQIQDLLNKEILRKNN